MDCGAGNLIMRTLPQHETPSYADLCLKGMRRHVVN
jgi:hypothetical protein